VGIVLRELLLSNVAITALAMIPFALAARRERAAAAAETRAAL